ncbi:MAG: beta-ketoacyl synthase chain length factor [Pseudomonadales bacterium]
MTQSVACSLLHWAGWMPDVVSAEDWQAWAAGALPIGNATQNPAVDFIPAMQRRRLSRLSRFALSAANACAGEQHLPTVFASRHGEIHRTVELLKELARHEPLSPMGFSLSVHNTASGLYSIATGNTAPSTAIAAGCDTLPMAIIEAIGQLAQHEQVMVVYAEEPLPDDYRAFATDCMPLGLALLLGRASTAGAPQLQLRVGNAADNTSAQLGTAPFLRWLVAQSGELQTQGERFSWHWAWPRA